MDIIDGFLLKKYALDVKILNAIIIHYRNVRSMLKCVWTFYLSKYAFPRYALSGF